MRRYALIGPPGSGKGTQAMRLARHYETPHVSTGNMLRGAREQETSLGRRARDHMDRGELVPFEVVYGLLVERLSQPDCARGFILDGFPRNLEQAEALDRALERSEGALDRAVALDVSEEEIMRRMAGRRTCRTCQRPYHVTFDPPAAPDCCACGGELVTRADDREEAVRRRLAVYAEETAPLLDHYRAGGLLVRVAGTGAPDEVFGRVVGALG